MSSPPTRAQSPPFPQSQKRRMSVAALPQSSAKKPRLPPARKPSVHHPLRQTSFPPDPPQAPPPAQSTQTQQKEDEEEEDTREDDYGTSTVLGEGTGGFVEDDSEKIKLAILLDSFDVQQTHRYEAFRRANLNKGAVKKLANQVLSQSVTANVGTVIGGFAKIFTGEIIEIALKVQREWAAIGVEGGRPQGPLGPLLPDHLREATRRYKLERRGAVGYRGAVGGGYGNALGAGIGAGGEGAIGGVGRLFR